MVVEADDPPKLPGSQVVVRTPQPQKGGFIQNSKGPDDRLQPPLKEPEPTPGRLQKQIDELVFRQQLRQSVCQQPARRSMAQGL